MRRVSLAVLSSIVALSLAGNAVAGNCDDVIGECGPLGGQCDFVQQVVQTGFWYESEGGGAGRLCNGPEESNTKEVSVTTTSQNKKKFQLGCDATLWAGIFTLTGNWETENTNTSSATCKDTCSKPSCCVGPLYEYTRYAYEQRGRRKFLKGNPGTWCDTCAEYMQLCHLRKNPGGFCSNDGNLAGYQPALKTAAQACAGWQ